MTHTIVGVDIAKKRNAGSLGRSRNRRDREQACQADGFSRILRQSPPLSHRYGILQRVSTLGTAIDRDGPPSEADARKIRQGI